MNKINLLLLIATLDVGGAETQLVELAKRLDRERFNILVCCLTRGGPLEKHLKDGGINCYILGKRFKLDFRVIPQLVHLLRREKIDILHTWMFTSNSFGRLAGILVRVPVIIASERGVDLWKNKLHLFIDWLFSHFTSKIICVSEGVKRFYQEKGRISADKLTVIYNGIDIKKIEEGRGERIREEFELGPEDRIVSTVARLAPGKGIEYLLQALPLVIRHFPRVKCFIVGQGPEEGKLKELSRQLEISPHTVFTGLRNDIQDIISISEVFVLPSLFEGFSNVLLEAMALGKPVVATRIPGNDELVIDGKTGILIPPQNPQSLANAILSLLKEPQKGREMGEGGRERIKRHFRLQSTVKKTEELYISLLKSSNQGRIK